MTAREHSVDHASAAPGTDGAGATVAPLDPDPPERLHLETAYDGDDAFIAQWQVIGDIDRAVEACQRALIAHDLAQLRQPAAATVALSHDAAVRVLNRTYRQQDKATNVLSFPAPPSPEQDRDSDAPRSLGDVILALETLLAEAVDQDISPLHHFQHLVVHGVLHLLGYDHESDADAGMMEGLETAILARLGIADPYAEPPA